jgi:predicted ester cyclase
MMEIDEMTNISKIEQNRATVTKFLDGTHSGRLEVIDETVAEDLVTHGFPGGNPASREQYKQWFMGFQSGFSIVGFETLAMVADEEKVAVRWRFTVDHSGKFAGVEATGRRIAFDGMVLYRLENGLIVETWLHINELSLLQQVGAIPALAA